MSGFWSPIFWPDSLWPEAFWANVPGSEAAGTIQVTLDDVSSSVVGSAGTNERTGVIEASLSGVTASFGGTLAYVTNFDLQVGISVNWRLQDLPVVEGSIAATLDDVTGLASGVAWDFSYTDGFIGPTEILWPSMFWDWRLFPDGYWPKTAGLEDLTAALVGSTAEPGSFAGSIATGLQDLEAALIGRFTAQAQFNGGIETVLDGVASAFSGTSERPLFAGAIAGSLEDVSAAIVGLTAEAGSVLGVLRTTLAGVSGQLRGYYEIPYRDGSIDSELEPLTAAVRGLYVIEGGKIGSIAGSLTGVAMIGTGQFTTPRARSRGDVVTVTEIDWKTLCDQHNLGAEADYDYEFSNGRRFKQA